MTTLFSNTISYRPLADELRPESLDEIFGQEHLLSKDGPIGRMMETGQITSFILWGPPGCGKTTIARLMAQISGYHFEQVSAVFSGVADLRKIFDEAQNRMEMGQKTLLFVDEIHRFNKAQQDGFLPYVENGTVVLVGATTENPSFELNSALLSRCRVFILNPLDELSLKQIYQRILSIRPIDMSEESIDFLIKLSDGDGRYFIGLIENVLQYAPKRKKLQVSDIEKIVQKKAPLYDKADGHYNLISALHKSVRGSDPDAALYWLARMIEGGEDMSYLLRRMTRMAIEDIGLADPFAVQQALSAWNAYDRLGSPEGDLALAQLVVYLAMSPKSVSVYKGFKQARVSASQTAYLNPPMHILNAPTKLMEQQGFGKGYQYDPDCEDGFSGQNYFPATMERPSFYHPVEKGYEKELKKRMDYLNRLRREKCSKK